MKYNTKLAFKKAHTMTKMVIKKGDDYRVTFGLCLKLIISNLKKTTSLTGIYRKLSDNSMGCFVDGKVTKFIKEAVRPSVGDTVIVKTHRGKVVRKVDSIVEYLDTGTLVKLKPY